MNIDDNGIFGFDVSIYQDNNYTPQQIDFVKMREYGASFVVIKAGQGNYADPDFAYNWSEAKKAGLPRSSYFFLDKDFDAREQARKYWSLIKNDMGEGFLFVDFETGSGDWDTLYNFLQELKTLSGLPSSRIGIYTGYYYWIDNGPTLDASIAWFKQFVLWLSWYTDYPAIVKIPPPWDESLLVLWQKGTPAIGIEAGVESKEIDYNVFNGDAEKFKLIFNSIPVEPPPTGEEVILYYADLKANYNSNVRTVPSLSGAVVSVLTGPLTVSIVSEATQADGYNWYKISSPVTGYIALTTSYTNFRPAPPVNAPTLLYTIEFYSDGRLVINGEPYTSN